MISFAKSLYNKDFYIKASQDWGKKKILKFIVSLFIIYMLITIISPIRVINNVIIKKSSVLNSYYQNLQKNTNENPVVNFLGSLPPTWEITKENGLMLFDENNQPVPVLDRKYLYINLDIDRVTYQKFGSAFLYATKNYFYITKGEQILREFSLIDILDKDTTSMKAVIIKNKENIFEKIKIYIESPALLDQLNIRAPEAIKNKIPIANEATLKDIKKFGFTLIAQALRLIIAGLTPFILIFFIISKLALALFLAIALVIISKILKANIKFSNLFITALLIQSWYAVIFIFEQYIFNLPIFAPSLLVLLWGYYIINSAQRIIAHR